MNGPSLALCSVSLWMWVQINGLVNEWSQLAHSGCLKHTVMFKPQTPQAQCKQSDTSEHNRVGIYVDKTLGENVSCLLLKLGRWKPQGSVPARRLQEQQSSVESAALTLPWGSFIHRTEPSCCGRNWLVNFSPILSTPTWRRVFRRSSSKTSDFIAPSLSKELTYFYMYQ